jgi:hypothetical protein
MCCLFGVAKSASLRIKGPGVNPDPQSLLGVTGSFTVHELVEGTLVKARKKNKKIKNKKNFERKN